MSNWHSRSTINEQEMRESYLIQEIIRWGEMFLNRPRITIEEYNDEELCCRLVQTAPAPRETPGIVIAQVSGSPDKVFLELLRETKSAAEKFLTCKGKSVANDALKIARSEKLFAKKYGQSRIVLAQNLIADGWLGEI